MTMTPVEKIVRDASRVDEVRDALGRRLGLRRLTALDRLRLFKAVGSGLAENAAYLGMGMVAISVTSIDDVPVPTPASEAQLEALIAKLGDEGLEAASVMFRDPALQVSEMATLSGN